MLILTLAVGGRIFSKESGAKKLFPVRIQSQTGFNEFFIAEELGYFKEEGIQIRYIGILRPGTELATVVSDNNDVFMNHPNSVALAVLAGAKIKIVSPGMVDDPRYPHMIYLIRKAGAIRSAEDIRGSKRKVKVAVSSFNSCTDLLFLEWLSQVKIPAAKAEFIVMPDKEQEQALEQGLVDVITLHPAYYQRALNNPKLAELFNTWQVTKNPGGGASIRGFSEKFIRAHPEVVRGFVRALARSRKWINANQAQSIAIVSRRLGLKPEDVTVFWYDENDYIEESYMQIWFDMMIRHGQLQKGRLKPSDIYTNDYNPYYTKQREATITNHGQKRRSGLEPVPAPVAPEEQTRIAK